MTLQSVDETREIVVAEIHWLKPHSGNFDTASDWSGGVVPGPSDDAFIDASGAKPYTVKIEGLQYVNSLQVVSGATLKIGTRTGAGALNVLQGLSNSGGIVVGKGSYLGSED